MQLSHTLSAISVAADDPNLIGTAGLIPMMGLADQLGLPRLIDEHVKLPTTGVDGAAASPQAKGMSLVAAMCAGADSIEDVDLIRHGGMGLLFGGRRAATTIGRHLRAFRFGNVRQVDAVGSRMLITAAKKTSVLDGIEVQCLIDIDDTIKQVYGIGKHGAEHGYTGVRGLNAQIATITTPDSASMLGAVRLRRGAAFSGHGAPRMIRDVIATARRCGAGTNIGVRADSGYYAAQIITAIDRAGAWFSVVARQNRNVRTAIASIPEDAWVRIEYSQAIPDPDTGELISAAEVAEIPYTAFGSTQTPVTARLIVRRVPELNKKKIAAQEALDLPLYRYHPVFTNNPAPLVEAEKTHRQHAIVEQSIACLKAGPLKHLPSRNFNANAAWLAYTMIAFNLTRTLGCLTGTEFRKAELATIRRSLINIPARIARSARRVTIHLPQNWLWATSWLSAWKQITILAH